MEQKQNTREKMAWQNASNAYPITNKSVIWQFSQQ